MRLGDIIHKYRESHDMSMGDFAKLANVSKAYIGFLEKGINPKTGKDFAPSIKTIQSVAKAMNMDFDELFNMIDGNVQLNNNTEDSPAELSFPKKVMDKFGFKPVKTITLPLYEIACGEPRFMNDFELTVDVDADIKADYCLKAVGDSMINARIYPGDLILIKKCDIVDNGEIAVVAIGDDATLKRVYYYREENMLKLVPENPMYKPLVYSGAELDQVRILGKVIRVMFNL